MLESFLATLSPMTVMAVCILIGMFLRKKRILPENAGAVLSKLEITVLLPARVLASFMENCTLSSLLSQYTVVLYGAAVTGLSVVVGVLLARLFAREHDERMVYQYALVNANYGYLGSAIVPDILGPAALYSYILFYQPINVELYAWGYNTLIPRDKGEKQSFWKKLLNPSMVGMILGLFLGLTGFARYVPGFVLQTTKNLSACMGPVSMILTGLVIGGYDIGKLLKNKKVYIAAFLRLIVLPCVMVGFVWLLGADKLTCMLTLIATASALGLNTVVIPAAYGGDTNTGASMAVISHLACVITLPLLYTLFNAIL